MTWFRDGVVTACRRAIAGLQGRTVAFSPLELKALWLLADYGSRHPPAEIDRDHQLMGAGQTAITKVWLVHRRNPPPKTQPPPEGERR